MTPETQIQSEPAQRALDAATVKQLSFKPGVCRTLAIAIVEHYLTDRLAWADIVPLPPLAPEDKNCVGLTWRRLVECGIVRKTGDFKPSKSASRRGGVIWKYRLANEALARTFLERNNHSPKVVRGQYEIEFDGKEASHVAA